MQTHVETYQEARDLLSKRSPRARMIVEDYNTAHRLLAGCSKRAHKRRVNLQLSLQSVEDALHLELAKERINYGDPPQLAKLMLILAACIVCLSSLLIASPLIS